MALVRNGVRLGSRCRYTPQIDIWPAGTVPRRLASGQEPDPRDPSSSHQSSTVNQTQDLEESQRHLEQQHWLDRRFPSARPWLEKQNRVWWTASLQARCKQYFQLEGMEDTLAELLEMRYQELLSLHKHRITDTRSETHVQNACLALATHKVLSPWIKDSEELVKIVSENMGSHTSPALRFLLKASLYLTWDPYAQSARRLRVLGLDYGEGFNPNFKDGESAASLQMQTCLYKDIFDAEQTPELLRTCCCSQDSMWFEGLESHGVGFERTAWQGNGDRECCLQVERLNRKAT